MFAVKANRTVSIKQGEWLQVQKKKFQLHRECKIRTHVFSSLMAFVYLKQQASLGFSLVYAWVSHLFKPVVAQVSK